MNKENVKISFKSISEQDLEFLYELYREFRMDEIGISSWLEQEREEFIKNQFIMQHNYYMKSYNNASFEIILLNDIKIGRLYVDRREKEIRIIDIGFLKKYKNRGIGTIILKALIKESEERQVPLTLHVEYYNFAKIWYERFGFKSEGENGVYIFMKRETTGEVC